MMTANVPVVWLLEQIGSTEACEHLKSLASGAPHARRTEAAQSALQRLLQRR